MLRTTLGVVNRNPRMLFFDAFAGQGFIQSFRSVGKEKMSGRATMTRAP